jgi:hypothetical protein
MSQAHHILMVAVYAAFQCDNAFAYSEQLFDVPYSRTLSTYMYTILHANSMPACVTATTPCMAASCLHWVQQSLLQSQSDAVWCCCAEVFALLDSVATYWYCPHQVSSSPS